ncbi:MAG: hypothetical protein MHM6MM_003885 [Cercozoa sp. M6MM]
MENDLGVAGEADDGRLGKQTWSYEANPDPLALGSELTPGPTVGGASSFSMLPSPLLSNELSGLGLSSITLTGMPSIPVLGGSVRRPTSIVTGATSRQLPQYQQQQQQQTPLSARDLVGPEPSLSSMSMPVDSVRATPADVILSSSVDRPSSLESLSPAVQEHNLYRNNYLSDPLSLALSLGQASSTGSELTSLLGQLALSQQLQSLQQSLLQQQQHQQHQQYAPAPPPTMRNAVVDQSQLSLHNLLQSPLTQLALSGNPQLQLQLQLSLLLQQQRQQQQQQQQQLQLQQLLQQTRFNSSSRNSDNTNLEAFMQTQRGEKRSRESLQPALAEKRQFAGCVDSELMKSSGPTAVPQVGSVVADADRVRRLQQQLQRQQQQARAATDGAADGIDGANTDGADTNTCVADVGVTEQLTDQLTDRLTDQLTTEPSIDPSIDRYGDQLEVHDSDGDVEALLRRVRAKFALLKQDPDSRQELKRRLRIADRRERFRQLDMLTQLPPGTMEQCSTRWTTLAADRPVLDPDTEEPSPKRRKIHVVLTSPRGGTQCLHTGSLSSASSSTITAETTEPPIVPEALPGAPRILRQRNLCSMQQHEIGRYHLPVRVRRLQMLAQTNTLGATQTQSQVQMVPPLPIEADNTSSSIDSGNNSNSNIGNINNSSSNCSDSSCSDREHSNQHNLQTQHRHYQDGDRDNNRGQDRDNNRGQDRDNSRGQDTDYRGQGTGHDRDQDQNDRRDCNEAKRKRSADRNTLLYVGVYTSAGAFRRVRVWLDRQGRRYYDCVCGSRMPVHDLRKIKVHAVKHERDGLAARQCEVCRRLFRHTLALNAHMRGHRIAFDKGRMNATEHTLLYIYPTPHIPCPLNATRYTLHDMPAVLPNTGRRASVSVVPAETAEQRQDSSAIRPGRPGEGVAGG